MRENSLLVAFPGDKQTVVAMAQGIGFAVPSNTAQWGTTDILSYGRVRRRELGAAESIQVPRSLMRDADLLYNRLVLFHDRSRRVAWQAMLRGARACDVGREASLNPNSCSDYSEQVDLDGQIISATCGWFADCGDLAPNQAPSVASAT